MRRHHRQSRSAGPTGRARIGSPARNRRRSSASAAADGVPPRRLLLQALQADRLQVARDRRIEPPRRHRLVADDLEHRVHRRGRLERRPAGDQGIERRPQRIHVGRRADLAPLAAGLLRRHVAGRPHDLARAGQPAVALHLLGQAEVGDPRVAVLVEQDVGRLQVAVNHAALVGILDGLGDAWRISAAASRGGSGPSARRWERLCPSTKPIEK